MKNALKIIIINIIGLILIVGLIEFFAYKKFCAMSSEMIKINTQMVRTNIDPNYDFVLKYSKIKQFDYEVYKKQLVVNKGHSGKDSIIFFGCSFIQGYGLKNEQTLPYKITDLTGITSYNRAVGGNGPQHMLYELSRQDIYNEIPDAQMIIYTFIWDHYSRMNRFVSNNLFSSSMQPKYKIHNNVLIEEPQPNEVISSLFITRLLNEFQIRSNNINNDENFQLLFEILEKSYSLAREKYSDVKFVILMYEDNSNPAINQNQTETLSKAGFTVINVENLTNKKLLFNKNYMLNDNLHPNENAWNEIAPALVKELKLN